MQLNLKNDIVFKAFFARKGNEKYLKSFLEAVLNQKIEEIEIIRRSKSKSIKIIRQIWKIRYKSNN